MTRRAASVRRTPGQLGSVEALPSGRYRAFYRRDARKFTAPRTFATKTEANAWLAAEFADRARGVWRDPEAGRIRLADYATTWLDARPDLAPRTRDFYDRTIRRWIVPRVGNIGGARGVELGAMDVADISPAVLRAWYAAIYTHARTSAALRVSRDRERRIDPARAWGIANGMKVAATGRVSPAIIDLWRAAGEPIPTARDRRTVVPVKSAGETTAAQAYRVVRAILTTAVTDGLLAVNPCQIKGAGSTRHRERGTASPAEVQQLAMHVPRHLSAAVTLAAWSGLRYGELFALARRHVDPTSSTIHVERALEHVPGQPIRFGKTKTAKSERVVTLPAFVMDALQTHMDEYVGSSPEALLFTMPDGSPVPNVKVSVAFRAARAVIGRDDLTWHDLRHTGATLAYQTGASMPEVMRRLGHTTPRAASIYAHAADDSDQVLAARLDEMYGGTAATDPRRMRAV